jgi:Transposase
MSLAAVARVPWPLLASTPLKTEVGRPRPGGRKRDPLYRIRKLLLTAAEQLTEHGRGRLRAGLAVGDPTGEVAGAWQGKELLRAVYAADGIPAARAALDRFLPLGSRR